MEEIILWLHQRGHDKVATFYNLMISNLSNIIQREDIGSITNSSASTFDEDNRYKKYPLI